MPGALGPLANLGQFFVDLVDGKKGEKDHSEAVYYDEKTGNYGPMQVEAPTESGSTSVMDEAYQETIEPQGYLEGLFSSVGEENSANRLFNSEEAEKNREFQADEAKKNREFQEYMSNTSFQRAVSDLQQAGLNPALAYTNLTGATTPAGAAGSGSAASYNVGGGDTFSGILSNVSDIASAISDFLPSKKVVQVFKALGK